MTLAHADARSWAEGHSSADTPRLGLLEAVAFQAHPEVVATFGADGVAISALLGRQQLGGARRIGSGILMVLTIIGVVSPIAGMAVLGAGSYLIDRVSASASVPIAVVAFVVAAVTLIIALIAWMRSGARWSGMLCGLGVVATLCAGFAAISMPTVSGRDGYALPAAALIPVWVTIALGLLLVLALALRFRVREPEADVSEIPSVLMVSDRAAAMAAVATVSPQEQTAIRADRDTALRILADRELVDAPLIERALIADLGTLFTLDETRKAAQ